MKRANIALAIVSFIAISTSVFLLVRNNRSDEEDLREEDQLEIVKKLHTTIEVYLETVLKPHLC